MNCVPIQPTPWVLSENKIIPYAFNSSWTLIQKLIQKPSQTLKHPAIFSMFLKDSI